MKQCPVCRKKMIKRVGKYGEFWGCSAFPCCKGSRSIPEDRPLPWVRKRKTRSHYDRCLEGMDWDEAYEDYFGAVDINGHW